MTVKYGKITEWYRRIYIYNKKIQEQILQENHDLADIGHLGQQKMLNLIKKNYWWPGI